MSQITTSAIDQSLVNLDIRLESVASAIRELGSSFSEIPVEPTTSVRNYDPEHEIAAIGRKREVMMEEWGTVQRDSDELRKELADDKWLVVFRTVTEQADNMMASLEKIVKQCQVSIWSINSVEAFNTSPSHFCGNCSSLAINRHATLTMPLMYLRPIEIIILPFLII